MADIFCHGACSVNSGKYEKYGYCGRYQTIFPFASTQVLLAVSVQMVLWLMVRHLKQVLEQKRRGADIIKIVTMAEDMQQQIENLRITDLLKRELGAPFLFLSGGECSLHRRLGIKLGCCMALCAYEYDALSTPDQPLLETMKTICDNAGF